MTLDQTSRNMAGGWSTNAPQDEAAQHDALLMVWLTSVS